MNDGKPRAVIAEDEAVLRDELRARVAMTAARFSRVSQNETGDRFALARALGTLAETCRAEGRLAEARALENREKIVWQVTAEVGARVRLLQGVTAEIGYGQTSFQDAVLVPTAFFIPQVATDVQAGTSILYNTRDLLFGVIHGGVSFQF